MGVLVGSALAYCQYHKTVWFLTLGGGTRYARGWPFPYVLIRTGVEEVYAVRLIMNVLVSLCLVASTLLAFEKCARKRFQFGVRTLLGAAFVVALLLPTNLWRVAWPPWEPWYVRIGVLLGAACTVYWLCWLVVCGVRIAALRCVRISPWRDR